MVHHQYDHERNYIKHINITYKDGLDCQKVKVSFKQFYFDPPTNRFPCICILTQVRVVRSSFPLIYTRVNSLISVTQVNFSLC